MYMDVCLCDIKLVARHMTAGIGFIKPTTLSVDMDHEWMSE